MTVTDSRPAAPAPRRTPRKSAPPRRRRVAPEQARAAAPSPLRAAATSCVAAILARRDTVLIAVVAATLGFLVGTATASSSEPVVAPVPIAATPSDISSYGAPSYSSPSYSSPSYDGYSGYGSGTSGATTTSGPVSPESIGESTYIVGKGDGELPPGTYVGRCTGSLSSWARFGDGGSSDLLDYDSIYTSGQLVVTVKSSDSSVKFTGSCDWSKR